MKPRKLTKTMKSQIERAAEIRKLRRQLRKEHAAKREEFRMQVRPEAELYKSTIRSVDHGGHCTAANSMMAERFKEAPEVRERIEKLANSLAPAYNKGGYQLVTSDELAKSVGRKNPV